MKSNGCLRISWSLSCLYQLNLDGNGSRVYQKYWNESAVHFVEEEVSAHVFPAL